MKPLKRSVSISLDVKVIEYLQKFAQEQDRSLSRTVNIILKKFMMQQLESSNPNHPKRGVQSRPPRETLPSTDNKQPTPL